MRAPFRKLAGYSLVEMMIAVTLALLTGLAVLTVLQVYEGRKRTVTVGNDAQISASVGLYMLERELRMSGAGFVTPTGLLCNAGINIYYGGATVSNGAPLAAVRITDGGTGPDRLRLLRSDSAFGIAPATIVHVMASPAGEINVTGPVGLGNGDLFVVGAADGTKVCTLMQMTRAPQTAASRWDLYHENVTAGPYNPGDPTSVFTNAPTYDVGDIVVNLGQFGMRTYAVLCNDGAAPSATNVCDLGWFDALAAPATPTLANDLQSIAAQVVDFQAQYGVAPSGSQTVSQWVDATGGTWTNPSEADQRRIKAVRIALVTRGNLERDVVSPQTLVLWDQGLPTQRTLTLTTEQQRYRYKVLSVIVPLVNVIWAGV
jgi:type IV pilus assembly protein PilW